MVSIFSLFVLVIISLVLVLESQIPVWAVELIAKKPR